MLVPWMAGAPSALCQVTPGCCSPPQDPTHPAGLLQELAWLPGTCTCIPCTLLQRLGGDSSSGHLPSPARCQLALPAPRSRSGRSEEPPNLPFQSATLGTQPGKQTLMESHGAA